MKIITADPTGLCFGVKRAITTLENELKKTHQVYALGSPIHNPQETERLEKLGIETQKQLDVIERKIQTGDNRRQLIEQYTNLEHLDRETVETLIDYILVGKRIPGTRNVPIEIHWNF